MKKSSIINSQSGMNNINLTNQNNEALDFMKNEKEIIKKSSKGKMIVNDSQKYLSNKQKLPPSGPSKLFENYKMNCPNRIRIDLEFGSRVSNNIINLLCSKENFPLNEPNMEKIQPKERDKKVENARKRNEINDPCIENNKRKSTINNAINKRARSQNLNNTNNKNEFLMKDMKRGEIRTQEITYQQKESISNSEFQKTINCQNNKNNKNYFQSKSVAKTSRNSSKNSIVENKYSFKALKLNRKMFEKPTFIPKHDFRKTVFKTFKLETEERALKKITCSKSLPKYGFIQNKNPHQISKQAVKRAQSYKCINGSDDNVNKSNNLIDLHSNLEKNYKELIKSREREMDNLKREAEQNLIKQEEEENKRIREQTKFKAHPISFFPRINIIKDGNVTIPEEFNFHFISQKRK